MNIEELAAMASNGALSVIIVLWCLLRLDKRLNDISSKIDDLERRITKTEEKFKAAV